VVVFVNNFLVLLHLHIVKYAVKAQSIPLLKMLLHKDPDVNSPEEEGVGGSCPIHTAVRLGNTDIVRLLLENGANVNAKDHIGFTPLHIAVKEDLPQVAKLLLDQGTCMQQMTSLKFRVVRTTPDRFVF